MKKIVLSLLIFFCLPSTFWADNHQSLDLSPAKWIWYPAERTLENTFVLFRKEFNLAKLPQHVRGWILADSRYALFVNGRRVQWGPAPSDPRWQEADPLTNITPYLKQGKNVIAVEVCYFGTGDGTYTMGKPGLIINLDADGLPVVTDESWNCMLAKSWQPGKYKRWFLRALQEDFDANLYPYGWNATDYSMNTDWLKAVAVSTNGKYPSICNDIRNYAWEINGNRSISEIRPRSIPMMKETLVPVQKLSESLWLHWKRPAEEYFDMIVPNAYDVIHQSSALQVNDSCWEIKPNSDKAAVLTYEFKEQGVGWPYFTIDAPKGTIVEMLVHEGHKVGGPALMNSHFNSWTRFICKEGINRFETFDFESFRWIQLHIRNFNRPVRISGIGMRRRFYPWKVTPIIKVSNDTIQKVLEANINTLYNCEQETVVDGMARERQQYSGDGGHQVHASFQTFGDDSIMRRFINTFSQGISIDGYFMDSWPGWDRLARISEKQMSLSNWGPILDHGIGFCFDAYNYYLYSGDKEGLSEVYPRLIKFFHYVKSLTSKNEFLVPSEDIGVCTVWIDHDAFKKQRDKQLALNLYIAAMCKNALAPLCRIFNDGQKAKEIEDYSQQILQTCISKFWDKKQKVFVNNLPWQTEDNEVKYDDRSLATALIYDLCPDNSYQKSLEILADCPKELRLSYPCNAVWRQWALIKYRKMDIVLSDLQKKWGKMSSVWENNTLQEGWASNYDDASQWSHSAMAPIIALYQGIAGITPLKAGSKEIKICPQPSILNFAEFDVQTASGPVHFYMKGTMGKRLLKLSIPQNMVAELWLDARENVRLPLIRVEKDGLKVYKLSGGEKYNLKLYYL